MIPRTFEDNDTMWRDSNFVCFTIDLARVRPREGSYV
jgi:hypothetical protein